MAIERWRPFATSLDRWEPFRDVQSEVNRLFDSFFGRPTAIVTGTGNRVWMPALDDRHDRVGRPEVNPDYLRHGLISLSCDVRARRSGQVARSAVPDQITECRS